MRLGNKFYRDLTFIIIYIIMLRIILYLNESHYVKLKKEREFLGSKFQVKSVKKKFLAEYCSAIEIYNHSLRHFPSLQKKKPLL